MTTVVRRGVRRPAAALLAAIPTGLLIAGCSTAELSGRGADAARTGPTSPPAVTAGPALGMSCTSPQGWSVAYPDDWAVNAGRVAPACTRFAPDPFEVVAGSDARRAPVVLDAEAVAFAQAERPRADEEARTELTVDGRPAVRIERVTGAGLYPQGTPITSYVIDLGTTDDGPRTLIASAVGLPPFDHERDVAVLDAMIGSLDPDEPG